AETRIVWATPVRQVAWGNMFRRCQAGALMVDGDTGNAALVILHLLQSEEAITLTFLILCFELIGQSPQWFAIHNLTFF
ncbi:hypothetical protein QM259_19540, partial [Acinetobacter baumannii]|uniref:hypothetical protein n=1 Tax=Acinetobacter baumannii TaxID=470 RepID=UPI0024B7E1CD